MMKRLLPFFLLAAAAAAQNVGVQVNQSTGALWRPSAFEKFLVPSQTGHSGKYLTTNGTTTSWATVSGGGGTWGSITGTLADQTDLNTALGLKLATATFNGYFADPSTNGSFSASAWRTDLGLVIGTDVQAFDADLSTYAGITPSADVQSLLGAANYAAMRSQLSLVSGTNVQAYDPDLDTWAGVTPGSGVATFLATPSSANLASALTNETGTGAAVFASDPLLLFPNSAMGALAVDVTKRVNTKTVAADSTLTFSATATTGATFGLVLTNSDTAEHTINIPSSYSLALGATRTTFTLPASSTFEMSWRYDGTTYYLAGEPVSVEDLSVVTTATGDLIPIRDVSANLDGYATIANVVGTQVGVTVQAYDADLTTYAGITPSANVQSLLGAANYAAMRALLDLEAGTDFLAYPTGTPTGSKFLRDDNSWQTIAGGGDALTSNPLSQFAATTSAQLRGVIDDETGTGVAVFQNSPTLITPDIGTPSNAVLTNGTGLPISTGVSGLGTGVATALAANANAAGGVTTPDGTATLTNKTFDANGTGNVFKAYGYLTLTHPTVFASGTTQQTTVTSRLYGQALFGNATDKATNYVEYVLTVPDDLDTSVDLTAVFHFSLGGADTNDFEYEISMIDVPASSVYDTATGDAVSLAFTADATGADKDVQKTTSTTLTGWAAALTAGSVWYIRVARDGDHANDTSTVNSYSGPLVIRYGKTQ